MERISGACALNWSIDLEKGLRSSKPGGESIQQIGDILNQWNMEPELTLGVCNIFGLVPGEDRLFADTMLFRIVDAFVSGDKDTRKSIVKVFLSTLRHCKAKGHTQGIFSNMSSENRLGLLRRVKAVLSVDCLISRALVFVLLGCWAEFAKDVAEIRHLVLCSLTSDHVLEVKASLFAAGRFSELSDDFGYVFFEKLLTLVTSQKTFPTLRIAGAHNFAKVGCSFSLAVRSYKAGVELLQKINEEDELTAMLMALTKISVKTAILVPEQVVLLCSFLSQTRSSDMQSKILKCIRLIVENSACFIPAGAFPFQSLFSILDEPCTPSSLRFEILQTLLKMITHGLPDMLFKDTNEFTKLLTYLENATKSPFLSERRLAFESSVCVAKKLKRTETMSDVDLANFSSGIAKTVVDQVNVLANRMSGDTSTSEVGHELGTMLRLLLVLVTSNSKLGYFILDKLHLIIENFVNLHSTVEPETSEVHKIVDIKDKGNILPSRLLGFHIYNFLVAILETLDKAGGITEEVTWKLKDLICFVCGSSLFDCSIHTLYALIWHYHVKSSENEKSSNEKSSKSTEELLERETDIKICTKNMLSGGDNWCAYKAGKYAACKGVWDTANFIFHHLVKRVQSDVFSHWLRLLVQLTDSEKNLKVLLQQICICLTSDNTDKKTISSGYSEKLVEVCISISSSDKVLESISVQTQMLYFQRWFIELRRRVLLVMVDILKFLNNFLIHNISMKSIKNDMVSSLDSISSRFVRLSEEFDLVASSFIDMDSTSLKMMSDFSLTYSILAFFTKITTSIAIQNSIEASEECLNAIINDLLGRLWHMDSEICINLLSLLKGIGRHERSLHLLSKPQLSKVRSIVDDFIRECTRGVKRVVELKYRSNSVENEDVVLQIYKDGMANLMNVVKAWMELPFQIPKYFFRVRHTTGSLLFWNTPGARKHRDISVSPGNHLLLNLCIQLKNLPSDISLTFSKLYCILHCRKSLLTPTPHNDPSKQTHRTYQASETPTMIYLNKKLQYYAMKQNREFMKLDDVRNAGEVVQGYVQFKTEGRTQGFSTCVLDVSGFSVGSYTIEWHCGGVDIHGAYWSFLPLCPGPRSM